MTPILAARDCPPEILRRTRNALATVKTLDAQGWCVEAKLACGEDGTWSIIVRGRSSGHWVAARWEGGDLAGGLGFAGAWTTPPFRKLNYGDLGHEIKGTVPMPTPKQQAELAEQQREMLAAINLFLHIADPIAVLPQGTKDRHCKGKVYVGAEGLPFLPCSNATSGDPLCESCETGSLGTVEPPPASKSKTPKEYVP